MAGLAPGAGVTHALRIADAVEQEPHQEGVEQHGDGPKALDVSPRIGHIHVTVDDAPWYKGPASCILAGNVGAPVVVKSNETVDLTELAVRRVG